ncbi:hypothetical protein E2562_009568 [Oryza meyeriana var. granulata]|uniref:Uncharacterized protein n=1 Tax=Oryza meyeriana var. granulata TaxID=110450 RepID=A0A6G1F649_9ORYZ|nr:hypothetical protein E2562_009568 [Oryza meyeriana var. granulata]
MKNGGWRRNGRCQARLTLGSGVHWGDDVDAEPPAASTGRDTAAVATTRARRRWSRGAGQRRLAVARQRLRGRGDAEEEAQLGAAKDDDGCSTETRRGRRGAAMHWNQTAATTARQRQLGAEPGGGGTAQRVADAGGDDWRRGRPRQATGAAEGRRWASGRLGRVLPQHLGVTERRPSMVEVAAWLGRAQAAAGRAAARAEGEQGGGATTRGGVARRGRRRRGRGSDGARAVAAGQAGKRENETRESHLRARGGGIVAEEAVLEREWARERRRRGGVRSRVGGQAVATRGRGGVGWASAARAVGERVTQAGAGAVQAGLGEERSQGARPRRWRGSAG